MKGSNLKTFFVVVAIVTVACSGLVWTSCGGGGGGNPGNDDDDDDDASSVTVSFTPTSTATVVSTSTATTAKFSAAIAEPLSWYNLIKLQKDGTGANLCSAVSYDSTNRTISCAHDALDEDSEYILTVNGVKDSSNICIADASGTFTTSKAMPIESVTKTSIISTNGGSVNVTFNFSSAIPSGITPEVDVTSISDDDPIPSAGNCDMAGDRESCTTEISNVAGCNDPRDYTMTLSMEGYENYETFFNSADNEFENAATVATNDCWEKFQVGSEGDYDWSATGDNLRLAIDNIATDTLQVFYEQPFSSDQSGAFAVHIDSMSTLPSSGDALEEKSAGVMAATLDGNDVAGWNSVNVGFVGGYNYTGLFTSYTNTAGSTPKNGIPTDSGDLSDTIDNTSDIYICMTSSNNVLTSYVSTDGGNYVKLTEDNMECLNGSNDCALSEIDARSISDWDNLRLSIWLTSKENTGDRSFWTQFGFARFKTSNLDGSMADCPRMTR